METISGIQRITFGELLDRLTRWVTKTHSKLVCSDCGAMYQKHTFYCLVPFTISYIMQSRLWKPPMTVKADIDNTYSKDA